MKSKRLVDEFNIEQQNTKIPINDIIDIKICYNDNEI